MCSVLLHLNPLEHPVDKVNESNIGPQVEAEIKIEMISRCPPQPQISNNDTSTPDGEFILSLSSIES